MKKYFTLAMLGLVLAGSIGCTSASKEGEYVADPEVEEIIQDDSTSASADAEPAASTEEAAPVAETSAPSAPPVESTASSMTSSSSDSSLSLGTGSSGRGH